MKPSQIGVLVGAILGLALVLEGFGEMLIVALAAAIGWLIMRVVSGDVDVGEWIDRTRTDRRPR